MEITGKKLEEILKADLVGKDVGYSNYNFGHTVLEVVMYSAKEVQRAPDSFSIKYYSHSPNTVGITYMNTTIGEVSFKKQKGTKYGKSRYGSYDWTFKDIQVILYNESDYSSYAGLTFDEMLTKVYQDNQTAEQKAKAKLEQAKQIFQMIKEELGAKDDYEVTSFIEYMNKNRYSLRQ